MNNSIDYNQSDLIPDDQLPQRDSSSDDRDIDLEFSQIDNLSQVIAHLAWNQYRWSTIITSVLAVTIVLPSFYFDASLLFQSTILAFILLAIQFRRIQKKGAEWFMKMFAEHHDLSYSGNIPQSKLTGGLFQRGHSRQATNAVTTEINGHPLKLFYYQYSIKRGRNNRKTYQFTVLEIGFARTQFPYILLHAKDKKRRYSFPQVNEQEIGLEEPFADHYRLFTRDGYQTEVLQIFDHDALGFLKKEVPQLSIEFAKDKMYVYRDKRVTSRQELRAMFQTGEQIVHRLGPLLNRLEDDFAVLHNYYQ